jgi:acetate---CoA ligase (ADP-forming)
VLGEIPTISNPLDYHTFIWGDGPKTTEVFSAMLEAYDAGIYIIDSPRADRCDPSGYDPAFRAIIDAQKATGKIAFPVASMAENFGEGRVQAMMEEGRLRASGAGDGAGGDQGGADARRASRAGGRCPRCRRARPGCCRRRRGRRFWPAGVAVPKAVTGATALLTLDLAGLTPPYALKGLGFAHKTEAGAVRLGLTSLEGQAEMPGATGYLVEEMVTGAVAEVLLGLRRDPVYGVTLTLGMGG